MAYYISKILLHGLARIHRAGATFSKLNTTISLITLIIALTTLKKRILKTGRREYNTIKRNRFFSVFDSASDSTTPGDIARRPDIDIPPSTARTWLAKRDQLGYIAHRRTRNTSSTLGRPPLVSAADLAKITDQNDPIHEKSYRDQVQELDLRAAPRTLREHTNKAGARRYKKPF